MADELKFTLTITGEKGAEKTKIRMDFDPPINTKNVDCWDKTTVLHAVNIIVKALKKEAAIRSREVFPSKALH